MKKVTLLSLVAAAVLFTACGEDAKKVAAEATAKTVEVAKETAVSAVDTAKAVATEAAEAAKEKAAQVAAAAKEEAQKAADAVAQKAADAAQSLKERAAATTAEVKAQTAEIAEATKEVASDTVAAAKEVVAPAANNEAGKAAYAKCAGCHGADGKTKALGKSEVIAGQAVADLVTKMGEYKAGTRNVSGMGMLMKGQVASMSDEDIKAVSEYISAM